MITKSVDKLLFLFAAIAMLALLYFLRPVLLPFLISFVLAYLADPITDRVENLVRSRTLAILIVFVVLILIVAFIVTLLIPTLAEQINGALLRVPAVLAWFDEKMAVYLNKIGLDSKNIFPLEDLNKALVGNLSSVAFSFQTVLTKLVSSGAHLMGGLFHLILIPIVTFYLLRDWDKIIKYFFFVLPSNAKATVADLSKRIDRVLSEFFRGQLAVMSCLVVIYSVGLFLVGLELWFLAASIAGVFSFIPYVGIIVGVLFSLLGAIIQMADQTIYVGIILVFLIGQGLESIILSPLLVGNRVGLHPVTIIFAVMAGGELFGFFGVLAAIPVAAVGSVLVKHFFEYAESKN